MRPFIAIVCFILCINCKNDSPTWLGNVDQLYQSFYNSYPQYKEASIKSRNFKQATIAPLIQRLQSPFQVRKAGKSIEGRDIYRVTLGTGKTQVFLWSQMHGDESTATMAIMDLFNFFSKRGDEFDTYREKILNELTLTFIPMLNPDGAERFQRRNALGIDLNRDAIRMQCPESKILKQVRDELNADWGFNLHDQGRYYVGDKQLKIATFSFLAPAFNVEKDVNEKRVDAMQVIGFMNNLVQAYMPGKVGKYDDTFEPRAFGDNIQKWGTRTILIECGLNEKDPEKQEIRRVHFMLLLAAFDAIANKSYEQTDLAVYNNLPYNDNSNVFDLIVRGAQVEYQGKWYTVDVGFRRDDTWLQKGYATKPSITEFGDMSIFGAYNEINAEGYRAIPGKVYPTIIANMTALKQMNVLDLLKQGYTDVRLREMPKNAGLFPLNLLKIGASFNNEIRLNNNPCFVLQKNGTVHYAVVNGFGYDLQNNPTEIKEIVENF